MESLIGLDFKDFQSLQETQLNLDPGLNVIVGPSNLGKSAAIRALKALVYNAAAPGLIRDGAKELSVTAWFGDGQKLELVKGKNKSEFHWNEEVYAKAGANSIPEQLEKLWAIPTPDGRQLCFASQHEPPFLLAEPASAVAKVLGDLTNASILMEAVQKANKLRTQALNDAKARTREAEEAREEILAHAGLSARGKALEAAREAFRTAQQSVDRWTALVQLSEAFRKNEQDRKVNAEALSKNVNVQKLTEIATEAVDRVRQLEKLRSTLRDAEQAAALVNDDVWHYEEELESTNQEIHELLEQSGQCPLCNQPTRKAS